MLQKELLLIDIFNHLNLASYEALCMYEEYAKRRAEDLGEQGEAEEQYESIERKIKLAMDKVNKLLEIEREGGYE